MQAFLIYVRPVLEYATVVWNLVLLNHGITYLQILLNQILKKSS